jgi:hypothetical protein
LGNLKVLIQSAQATGSVRLFSIRHEFPTEWAKFQSQTPGANQRYALTLTLRPEHYPFWSQGRLKSVKRVNILARSTKASLDVSDQNDATAQKDPLVKDVAFGNLLVGKLINTPLPTKPADTLKLFFDDKTMEDLWIAVTWSSE